MNKRIRLIVLLAVYTIATLVYVIGFKPNDILSEKEEVNLELKAISQIQNIYPEFQPADKSLNYVSKSNNSDIWYAYIFDRRDGGLGYEVYYDGGKYSTNFNKDLLLARLKLINKMNELMPENLDFNQYVAFNPYGIKGNIQRQSSLADGMVSFALYKDSINVDEQLKIDFQIVKYSSELLKELGFTPKGIAVSYYEVPKSELRLDFSKTYLFSRQDRDSGAFDIYFDNLKKYKPKFKYMRVEIDSFDSPFLVSEKDFIQEAHKNAY